METQLDSCSTKVDAIKDAIYGWKYDDSIAVDHAQPLIRRFACFVYLKIGRPAKLHILRNYA